MTAVTYCISATDGSPIMKNSAGAVVRTHTDPVVVLLTVLGCRTGDRWSTGNSIPLEYQTKGTIGYGDCTDRKDHPMACTPDDCRFATERNTWADQVLNNPDPSYRSVETETKKIRLAGGK